MNPLNPRKTNSGESHQVSRRVVWLKSVRCARPHPVRKMPSRCETPFVLKRCLRYHRAAIFHYSEGLRALAAIIKPVPANRLAQEKSPYLLQHAHNPVDWYPWGEEAFEKARRENKADFSLDRILDRATGVPRDGARILRESDHIADLMNRWFVSIKVDREERPDIDSIYMAYVQATTGGGGWPMSVWLTPDLKPFVGGTYFPPEDRYGRAGFPLILERVAEAWKNDRNRIIESSEEIPGAASAQCFGLIAPPEAAWWIRRRWTTPSSSFGARSIPAWAASEARRNLPGPRFTTSSLRYWKRTGNEEALDMVEQTLLAMDRGGMNDQLGGGFHRYSVDERWFVPHFEKMLYDQAQLADFLMHRGVPDYRGTMRSNPRRGARWIT